MSNYAYVCLENSRYRPHPSLSSYTIKFQIPYLAQDGEDGIETFTSITIYSRTFFLHKKERSHEKGANNPLP